MRYLLIALALVFPLLPSAKACQSLIDKDWEESPSRVRLNFDRAQFVVVATVIAVKTVYEPSRLDPGLKTKLERSTFRVNRAYKGRLRPGDTFQIDSGWSSCGRGVRGEGWLPFIPGRTNATSAYPKQWLIYHTPSAELAGAPVDATPFEISVSPMSRPAEQAKYDLSILDQLQVRAQ